MSSLVSMRPMELEYLLRQLHLPVGQDFNFTAARALIAMVEAVAMRMDKIDRLQIGRLMVSSGHVIEVSCKD
jgi:hypothetical protein